MSNWDLMMPGMGLTAIGLAGLVTSYAGIAHTFIDGMHALTGLTMIVGLIFLSAGILEGGVSTSNRAKATTLVIMSIALSFGVFAFTISSVSTIPVFAGVLLIIAVPAIVIAYVSMKMPEYAKPVSGIFVLAAGAGIAAFIGFGLAGPDTYLIEEVEEVPEEVPEAEPTGPIFSISILEGSSQQGNPDYDPDVSHVPQGHVIEWTNDDVVVHTATSAADFGETFDSGMIDPGATFQLDTSNLAVGEYEYLCIVHPFMRSTLVIEEPNEPARASVSIPQGSSLQEPGKIYYDPVELTVAVGTTVVWTNNDNTMHTVTSTAPEEEATEVYDSQIMEAGQTFEHTFNTAGTSEYFCFLHPWMEGSIIVE